MELRFHTDRWHNAHMRHGGQILVDQLAIGGCGTVFTVPGESFLPVLDGLHDKPEIATIVCRNEGGATIMAEAYGKLHGKPGIALVTRGPGATNASAGIHIAQQDQTPLILLVGLPPLSFHEREAFQEIDLPAFYGSMAKWVAIIKDASRIPEHLSRAHHIALSGRPGPVVLGLPEDILHERVAVDDMRPPRPAEANISASDLSHITSAIKRSERPLMIVGGPGWSRTVQARIEEFASRFQIPVASAFRCQGHFDNRHPNYCGHLGVGPDPELVKRVQNSDLVFLVGARMDEITTTIFSNLDIPAPQQYFIHAHPSPDVPGRISRADLPIACTSASLADALSTIASENGAHRADWCWDARRDYEEFILPVSTPGAVKFEQIVRSCSELLDEDAIITSGAGNYSAWLHRYFEYKGFGTQLAPISGSMGYGLPAAIAAKLAKPEKQVVAFAGDGCLMMSVQELATAAQYGVSIVVIVVNNGMLGTIRMHQERHFPGRVIGTQLANPDFQALGQSFGAQVSRIEETTAFRPALRRALDHEGLSLIEIMQDPDALSPRSRG